VWVAVEDPVDEAEGVSEGEAVGVLVSEGDHEGVMVGVGVKVRVDV